MSYLAMSLSRLAAELPAAPLLLAAGATISLELSSGGVDCETSSRT